MTAKQRSWYLKVHPSGAGESQAGASISNYLENSASCTRLHFPAPPLHPAAVLCPVWPHVLVSHVQSSLSLQMVTAPDLFDCSPVVGARALPGQRALLRATVLYLSVQAWGGSAGEQLCGEGPGCPGGQQVNYEPAVCPGCQEGQCHPGVH